MLKYFYNLVAKVTKVKPSTVEFILTPQSGIYKYLALKLPLLTLNYIASFGTPLLIKRQVDLVSTMNQDHGMFMDFLYIVVGIGVYNFVVYSLSIVESWFTRIQLKKTEAYISDQIIERLALLDHSKFEDKLEGMLRSVKWYTPELPEELLKAIGSVISVPLNIIGFAVIAQFVNPIMLLIISIVSILTFLLDWYRTKLIKNLSNRNYEKRNFMGRLEYRLWADFAEINLSGKLGIINDTYRNMRDDLIEDGFSRNQQNDAIGVAISLLSRVGDVLNTALAGYLVFTGAITIGTYSTFPLYNSKAESVINSITELFNTFTQLRLKLDKVEFVLDIESSVDLTGTRDIESIETIEFKDVAFSYSSNKDLHSNFLKKISNFTDLTKYKNSIVRWFIAILNPVDDDLAEEIEDLTTELLEAEVESKKILKGFSLKIKNGEFISLIGNNGCGKSTALRMISRAGDPTSGTLLINGLPIQEFDHNQIRNLVSFSTQRQRVMPGYTLRQTLNFTNDEGLDDEKMLEILNFLELPYNISDLDKIVGDGLKMSGGQEQLVILTSIFLNHYRIKKTSLIILDEGTNQIDPKKKSLVLLGIKKYLNGSIVVLVSHEMNLCVNSDRVVVLEDGRVSNDDTPATLLKTENLFKEFHDQINLVVA